jgi:hypothetical protein
MAWPTYEQVHDASRVVLAKNSQDNFHAVHPLAATFQRMPPCNGALHTPHIVAACGATPEAVIAALRRMGMAQDVETVAGYMLAGGMLRGRGLREHYTALTARLGSADAPKRTRKRKADPLAALAPDDEPLVV